MEDIYPITIIRDRYNGTYSGGKYLAFNLNYDEIPPQINADDVTCFLYWQDSKILVGKGAYMGEAYDDLCFEIERRKK